MAVSLESNKRYKANALYEGGRLYLTHCTPIVGGVAVWRDAVMTEIKDKFSKGFAVLVEDRTGSFCADNGASQFAFDEIEDGRTMLYQCLDWYFALYDMGNIVADAEAERFLFRSGGEGSMVDRQQDDKGRTTYNINWSAFTGAHKAVLMCVAGAVLENPWSERWLAEMYGPKVETGGAGFDPRKTIEAITRGHDKTRVSEFEAKVREVQGAVGGLPGGAD